MRPKKTKIRSVLRKGPPTVATNATAQQAAQALLDQRAPAAAVVTLGQPVGILTGHDILKKVVAAGLNPRQVFVADIMNPAPVTVSEDRDVETVLLTMRAHNVRNVLINDDQGGLVGLASYDDCRLI